MTLYRRDGCEKCDNQGVYSCQSFPCEHGGHTCEACSGNGWKFVSVVLDPVTRWCFAHGDEVFTEVGTDKPICARHLRSPCDIDDAAVIRIGEEI